MLGLPVLALHGLPLPTFPPIHRAGRCSFVRCTCCRRLRDCPCRLGRPSSEREHDQGLPTVHPGAARRHGWRARLPDSQDLGNGDGGASAVQSHFDAELDSALEGPASLHTAKADPAKVETSYTFHTTDPENVTAPIDKPHIATVGFQHHHAEAISQRGIIATREPQLKLKFTDGPQAATANPPHNAQRNPLRLVKKRPAEGVQTESESPRIRFLLRRFALGPAILIMLLSALSTYGVVRWMSVKCPQCGRLLERGSIACRDCGAQLMTAKPY
jgi:hypothetical protein